MSKTSKSEIKPAGIKKSKKNALPAEKLPTTENVVNKNINSKADLQESTNSSIVKPKNIQAATKPKVVTAGDAKEAGVKSKSKKGEISSAPAKKSTAAAKKEAVKITEEKTAEAPAKKTSVKKAAKPKAGAAAHKITFLVRFHTKMGESLFISGAHGFFGNNDIAGALPMRYINDELWSVTLDVKIGDIPAEGIVYNYLLRFADGTTSFDWGSDKVLTAGMLTAEEILIVDSWNFAGYFENTFYTEPFKRVLLAHNHTSVQASPSTSYTHTFRVKSPLLVKGQTLFLLGDCEELGEWNEEKVIVMSRKQSDDFFTADVNLSKVSFPVFYKYGIYEVENKKVIRYEDGDNRMLYDAFVKNKKTVLNDGFTVLPSNTWKGAGVAIPVFSLRSAYSGGCGEFKDLKHMVDWAKRIGLKLIQILPVNDTTATHAWTDSYPYSAISAFALHPMYINLWDAADEANKHIVEAVAEEFQRLNKLDTMDYEAVNSLKWTVIKQLYTLQNKSLFASSAYKAYFDNNKHWLIPYALFSYFRDNYNTADFTAWPAHKKYVESEGAKLLNSSNPAHDRIAIHFFVQYYLHVQLKEATGYAHENGVIVKGDIPIGIYRYGSDAWQRPELYHMEVQAGAPPDDFAITGQNWGFPTYNWETMRQDGFSWWKQRLEQMSYYFDAFRIDHILGFFRIWSIPLDCVEGIMGHFEPAIPIHINEFREKNIWFDYARYCKPFISENILKETFGGQANNIVDAFLNYDDLGKLQLKAEFSTQRLIENYFIWQPDNDHNRWLKKELLSLVSNVILFEAENSNGKQFHFRFGMEETSSFRNLETGTQHQLKELYINYFFRRQDDFWSHEARQKLPALKRETNMLVCGEDLGLVPGCVPEVMRQLGILSLEIQRMPKDPKRPFFHPADAPYMSVVTPSTHDMSTIRGWWEEDRNRTQEFFNNELGQWGDAPYFCDAWVNKTIVVQHLFSPAMWSIFQLQDILGSDTKIRKPNPHEERINVPANPKHYWNYRMHLRLEDLNNAEEFNNEFSNLIKQSGRA